MLPLAFASEEAFGIIAREIYRALVITVLILPLMATLQCRSKFILSLRKRDLAIASLGTCLFHCRDNQFCEGMELDHSSRAHCLLHGSLRIETLR